ncbi:Neuron navigator 3 [Stylophora pistillata]|uniref:Neuron navigator 3 n=1 Tax=Stylophora pistillata TaxID=50429 RepID=A0A2B4RS57_STYPI|nr:Neuron navigator 3 [Stylophora pistillata]
MTDTKHTRGHSRKLKIGVGGKPVQSWQHEVEMQPTSSLARATAAQNTDSHQESGLSRHPVAQGTQQAFAAINPRGKKEATTFPAFHSKNAPVKVSVTGEWALKECEEHTFWANNLLKRGKRRLISDIRRSIGDGQTLVYVLETLAGQKIPGVYARPVTRAQKLENLQLCMSFMGNRNINLQGIYVGDLIDGNVKSVLNLCRNIKAQFEGGWVCPDGPRPGSSGSTKEEDFRLMSGTLSQHPVTNGYDVDLRLHGNSSGYHSDDASPMKKSEGAPIQEFRMPGMLDGHEEQSRKIVQPSDVIIMSRTELDKRGVLQTSENPQVRTNGTISLEERLKTLLSSPNPGGQAGEETEEELIIPPPPKGNHFNDDDDDDDDGDVERRLQSLLDVAEEDKPDMEIKTKDFSGLKELDRIGYVGYVCTIPSRSGPCFAFPFRMFAYQGLQKLPWKLKCFFFFLTLILNRGAKLPSAPLKRQTRLESDSPAQSPRFHRKLTTAVGLTTRATAVASEIQASRPQMQRTKDRSGSVNSTHSESGHAMRLVKGEGTPPKRFQRTNSRSNFLKQVAEKLADRSTTPTVSGSESVSPADTPMLPTLSPSSSVATFVFVSESESSGLSSDEEEGRHWRRRSSVSSSRSRGGRDKRNSIASGVFICDSSICVAFLVDKMALTYGKAKSTPDLQEIRTQLEFLEEMYSEILISKDVESKDSKKSSNKFSQRTAAMQASLASYKKQRNKDIKAVNKRFGRLESHVVTLARSVAHLSSELRSQASLSQDVDDMRRQVQDQQLKTKEESDAAKESAQLQSIVKKLKSFFGEDPPLLALFLKKLGYERFVDNFEAEQVGILEVAYMTEERLQSLGIPLGPRLRIMEEVKKFVLEHTKKVG